MTILTDDLGNNLVDLSGVPLTDELDLIPPPVVSVFPLMLLMRLGIHAAWLLFMLIPS